MLRMIDRHAVTQMLTAGVRIGEVARHFEVSRRTIERIRKEPAIETAEDGEARRQRRMGRPGVPEVVKSRIRALMETDPVGPPLEVLRRIREEGVELGESTFCRLYRIERGKLPKELMVRFEGVAGEFALFDFGPVDARLVDAPHPLRHAGRRVRHPGDAAPVCGPGPDRHGRRPLRGPPSALPGVRPDQLSARPAS